MRVTPTEPLGHTAAELALELNVFGTMLLAILDSATNRDRRALSANQLLLFEILVIVLSCLAVFHSTEVGVRTFEATIIG